MSALSKALPLKCKPAESSKPPSKPKTALEHGNPLGVKCTLRAQVIRVAGCTADMLRFLAGAFCLLPTYTAQPLPVTHEARRRSAHSKVFFRRFFSVPKYVLAHLGLRVPYRIFPRVTTGNQKSQHLPLCCHAYFFRRSPVRAVLRYRGNSRLCCDASAYRVS